MARLFPLILALTIFGRASGQIKMSLLQSAAGAIADAATEQVRGTGFVIRDAGGNAVVLTCFHVAHESGYKFITVQPTSPTTTSTQTYLLTLKYTLPAEDVVVFSPDRDINTSGLVFAAERHRSIGENVIYLGYKTETRDFMVSAAPINATGTGQTVGGIADFVEFVGQGKPGYSGGPVMTDKGEVIGIFTEAWAQRGYQSAAPIMNMNKAVVLTDIRAKLFPKNHQTVPQKKTPKGSTLSRN